MSNFCNSITGFIGDAEVDVIYEGYEDPGCVTGPYENCYPPDSDIDVVQVLYKGRDITKKLNEKALLKLIDQCWDDLAEGANPWDM